MCWDAAPIDLCRDVAPIDLYRDAAPIDLYRDATAIDLHRDAAPIDLCRDAAPIDLCRDAAPMDLHRDAAPIDLCRDAAPIDLCRDAAPTIDVHRSENDRHIQCGDLMCARPKTIARRRISRLCHCVLPWKHVVRNCSVFRGLREEVGAEKSGFCTGSAAAFRVE